MGEYFYVYSFYKVKIFLKSEDYFIYCWKHFLQSEDIYGRSGGRLDVLSVLSGHSSKVKTVLQSEDIVGR